MQDAGRPVHAIGKIGDIFSMRGIDDVVKGAKTELDLFVTLRDWTRHQWDKGWGTAEYHYCAPPDALLILVQQRPMR